MTQNCQLSSSHVIRVFVNIEDDKVTGEIVFYSSVHITAWNISSFRFRLSNSAVKMTVVDKLVIPEVT